MSKLTNTCSEGAGDCDSDSDCFGDLRCGSNNCEGNSDFCVFFALFRINKSYHHRSCHFSKSLVVKLQHHCVLVILLLITIRIPDSHSFLVLIPAVGVACCYLRLIFETLHTHIMLNTDGVEFTQQGVSCLTR